MGAEAAGEGRGWQYYRCVWSPFLSQDKAAAMRQPQDKHQVPCTYADERVEIPCPWDRGDARGFWGT